MQKPYLTRATLFLFLITIASGINASGLKPEDQLQTFLTENKGNVVYVDFWASWCVPCRKSFPWMTDMQNKYRQKGLRVITINVDAEHQLAELFLKENIANFPIIFDPKGQVADAFHLKGMPSSFVINRTGEITYAHVGFFTNKQKAYELELTKLLDNK